MASKKKKLRKLQKKQARQKKKVGPKKKVARKADTWKKKSWYKILAPKMFQEKEIGETIVLKEKNLIGRQINVPLSVFTNKILHQQTILSFVVSEIKGKTAYTEPKGFELTKDALRKDIRRRRSLIKTILNLKTKDGKKIRMTTYVFTITKIDTQKQKDLRAIVDEQLKDSVPKGNYLKIFQDSIYGDLASSVYKKIKKLHKIRRVEIGKIKTLS